MTDVNKCTSSSNFVWLVKSLYICPYLSYESGIIGKPSFVRTVHLKHLPSTYERHMSSQRKYYISINPYSAEILYLYLHSPGPVLILQDDNAGPHMFSQGYYKLTSERGCGENGVACQESRPQPQPNTCGICLNVLFRARVTNVTNVANLRQIPVEGWDAIWPTRVTRLVTSTKRSCVLTAYKSPSGYCGSLFCSPSKKI